MERTLRNRVPAHKNKMLEGLSEWPSLHSMFVDQSRMFLVLVCIHLVVVDFDHEKTCGTTQVVRQERERIRRHDRDQWQQAENRDAERHRIDEGVRNARR